LDELMVPADKRKAQQQIAALLNADRADSEEKDPNTDTTDTDDDINARRAQLMREYKQMKKARSAAWKNHQTLTEPLRDTLRGLKSLVREITLGRMRLQEIRQHVLDLHFKKKHAKSANRLVLSDAQLERRQKDYEKGLSLKPSAEECRNVSNAVGSGCYLSTLSRRECVMDGEPLWMVGRVDRSGGAAVSNPELIRVEYVSPDLVSDSYFRMAVEAAAGGSTDEEIRSKENQNASVTFCDSARQRVNCRLFPIYANDAHFRATSMYFDEATAHCVSGRVDMRAADYNLPSAIIGHMIGRTRLSQHNVRRLLFDVRPSMQIFLRTHTTFPFDLSRGFKREADRRKAKRPLAERRRMRLEKYISHFAARTSAWVTTASVLFADRLLNLDLGRSIDHEFYLSLLTQRLRAMFAQQAQGGAEDTHKRILRVLVCGYETFSAKEAEVDADADVDKKDDAEVADADANEDAKEDEKVEVPELVFDGSLYRTDWTQRIDAKAMQPMEQEEFDGYDASVVTPSMVQMVSAVVSRVDIRDLMTSKAFFDVLSKLGPDALEAKSNTVDFDAFSTHKFADPKRTPNDFNALWEDMGCDAKMDKVQVLRAICAVSLVCHSNRVWQDNVQWFGDDTLKQLFNDPNAVLTHIHRVYLKSQVRRTRTAKKSENVSQGRWVDGVYRYRESDIPNRHGHCNSNPSEWALRGGK